MKLLKKTVVTMTVSALFSSLAFAGHLSLPRQLEVLAFDGLSLEKGTTPQINANSTHQLVVSVSDIVDGNYFSTAPIILTFTGTKEDLNITLPKFRSSYDVDKFKAQPTFKLQTTNGQIIPHKQDILKGKGFAPNSRIEENLSKYNTSNGVASVPAFSNAIFTSKGQVVIETKNVKQEQLQLLFSNADKETQQRFLDWAKKNVKK